MPAPDPPLRFADRFTHLVRFTDGIVLVEDVEWQLFEDPMVCRLLERIDGNRTAGELAATAGGLTEQATVHFLLQSLLEARVVEEATVPEAEGAEARSPAGHLGSSERVSATLVDALAEAWRGAVAGVGTVPPHVWIDLGGLTLVLTDDYLRPELPDRVGYIARDEGAVLLARVGASEAWVGPVVGRDDTLACLDCLRARLRQTLPLRALLHLAETPSGVETRQLGHRASVPFRVFERMAEEVGRRGRHRDRGEIVRLRTGRTVHEVPRFDGCSRCGAGPSRRLPDPTAEGPLLTSSGGYRVVGPEETWMRLSGHIDELTGLVRGMGRVDTVNDEMHVYTASHTTLGSATSVALLRGLRRDQGGGKGRTDLEARVSALCECIERHSALHRGTEPVRVSALSKLGRHAWHPGRLLGFSERQYAERDRWNSIQNGHFQFVPEPYSDDCIEWVEAVDLVGGGVHLLPAAYVYSSFRGEGARFCRADSNGLSAGNRREEAVLQGFFELVERDAVAIWWYNRLRRPPVTLSQSTVDRPSGGVDPWIGRMLAAHERVGRRVEVLDLTTDLGIPVRAAISAAVATERPETVFGFGAHFDQNVATRRAITELNQMLPSVLASAEERRRQLLPDFADAIRWWEETRVGEVSYLRPDPAAPRAPVGESPPPGATLGELVDACAALVARSGMPLLVHDLTRPDTGLPVVKVVVPGLRHFWRRLGRGRLYDVPLRLGWVQRPPAEAEMNPVSLFV